MGFLPKGVWIMDYCGFMGYDIHFSANQLGGPKKVWGIREYGLLELWVKRELTVCTIHVIGWSFPADSQKDGNVSSTRHIVKCNIYLTYSFRLSGHGLLRQKNFGLGFSLTVPRMVCALGNTGAFSFYAELYVFFIRRDILPDVRYGYHPSFSTILSCFILQ